MASNKFATMLHRNTNKMVVILVYAVLEWILIILLLLNSLFSYLITKFAKFVGLKPPCLWCSRVDLDNGTNLHKDLVCETHAAEISKLGYCSNHQKLAETQSMCENCLASRPNHHEINSSYGMRHHRIGFLSWVSHENGDNVNKCSCCNESLSLSSQIYPPYLLLKPSWGDGNYPSKGSLIVESMDDDDKEGDKDLEFERNNGVEDHDDDEGLVAYEHQILSDIESFILREVGEDHSSSISNLNEKDVEKDEKEDDHDLTITEPDPSCADNFMHGSHFEDRSLDVINMSFENHIDCDNHRLIPIKFIDSITSLNFESCKLNEDLKEKNIQSFATESPIEAQSSILEGEVLLTMEENAEKTSMIELESFSNFLTLEVEELKQNSVVEVHAQRVSTEEAQTSINDDDNSLEAAAEELDNAQDDHLPRSQEPIGECTQEDESQSSDDDDDAEVQDAFAEFISQNNLSMSHCLSNDDKSLEADMEEPENTPQEPTCSSQCIPEDQSSTTTSEDDTEVPNAFDEFIAQNNLCPNKTRANDNEYAEMVVKTTSVEKIEDETSHQSSKCSESCEVEEDKLPETPNSTDGLHYLQHRKLMLFEKRESGAEDSGDGSITSEVEYGNPVLTIDRLKTALKAEQRALSAIYQELEEERSASAIAANQTMAMITRLQEEKAAMQMEALQYQRMMEEQAEYDQEALQLLNDLMMKREKEKQELEKELEEYRQKVMEYEAKEKLRVLRRMKDGNGSVRSRDSSCSCCNTGYTDDLSIDLNHEARQQEEEEEEEENDPFNHDEESIHANANAETVSKLEEIALDCVKHVSTLDSTLAEFEEEKASILDQLKALEEKIISLEDNEEFLDDIKLNEKCNFSSPEEYSNGFSDDKNSQKRTMGSLAKKLLPYLDAAENENEEEACTFERQLESESMDMQNSVAIGEMDNISMKVSIEEEVDRVYERLQALETDREFLQHCMGSIQNGGDKGSDLLQEILQHLRDLKDVELRMKNLGND